MTYSRTSSQDLVKRTFKRSGITTTDRIVEGPLDPIEWIQSEFWVPELKGPMILAPYQEAALREAYRRDENGDFIYSVILWGDIKKSIKSCIAAAVCMERARTIDNPPVDELGNYLVDQSSGWGTIYIVANDLKQADSREAYYIRRAIELNPRLRALVKANRATFKITYPRSTVIEPIPIDPTGEAGSNADLIVFTELWGANSAAAERMWAEMTLSPTKDGQSQRWVETYAGYSGESDTLENLWELGVKEGRKIDEEIGFPGLEIYANDNAGLLCLWNDRPRLAWQTPKYYARERAILPANEFDRMHGNKWVTTSQKFVPDAWWEACRVKELPAMDIYPEVVVSLDAAIDGDCFGILAASRHGKKIAVRFSRKWTATKGQKIRYSNPDDPADMETPEGVIRWLVKTYDVIMIGYDQYQLHELCSRLMQENVAAFEVFDQGKRRMVADKKCYDLIQHGHIMHLGDPDLTEHVQNANSTAGDDKATKMRIVKRSNRLKIDLCVCLSMAAELALYYLPE